MEYQVEIQDKGQKARRGKGFDGPLLPDMAARVLKTNGRGTTFLSADDHAEAAQYHPDRFNLRVIEFLQHHVRGVEGDEARQLQQLLHAVKHAGFAQHFWALPYDMRAWLVRADRFRLRFYFAWCLIQAKLGNSMPQHYLDVLKLGCPAEIFTRGDWAVFFAELALQVKQNEAERAAQAA